MSALDYMVRVFFITWFISTAIGWTVLILIRKRAKRLRREATVKRLWE